jgi:hypothetical protein
MRRNLWIAVVAGLALPALGACDMPGDDLREEQEEMVDERADQREDALEQEYEQRQEALEQQEEQLDERIEDEGPLPAGELDQPMP